MKRIQPWQKLNHFPGMSNLARKSRLAKNMQRMQKHFPREYSCFPKSWVLPVDMSEFRTQFGSDGISNKTFIVKPDSGCQGRGIFLTRDLNEIIPTTKECMVAQRYIKKPLLIEGFKFDLRLYMLVSSCKPLELYLFNDGLTRLCTTQYVKPTNENMSERCMHLTNYAINKKSENFEFNEDADDDGAGSKRSLRWFMKWLEETHGAEAREKVWARMSDLCIKMMIAVQPILQHEYEHGMTKDSTKSEEGSRCFQILGVDVMIDENLRPWLIEVNHLPSFKGDTPLDVDIKSRLIEQTLALVPISGWDKRRYQTKIKTMAKERLAAGIEKAKVRREQEIMEEDRKAELLNGRGRERRERRVERETRDQGEGEERPPSSERARGERRRPESEPGAGKRAEEEDSEADSSSSSSPTTKSPSRTSRSAPSLEGDGEGRGKEEGEEESVDEDEDDHLIDFMRIYPPPASNKNAAALMETYERFLTKSRGDSNASVLRLRAPLQQKKGEDIDEQGGTAALPPIAKRKDFGRDCFGHGGTDRRYGGTGSRRAPEIKKQSAKQTAMADRLSQGFASNARNATRSAPATLYKAPERNARNGIAYGQAYQKKIQAKQTMPTMALKTCNIGLGMGLPF
jgi:tubulin polyglutamylase TTLL6/13